MSFQRTFFLDSRLLVGLKFTHLLRHENSKQYLLSYYLRAFENLWAVGFRQFDKILRSIVD